MVKKLKFKVHRDQARLFALKRDEDRAMENHRTAERILKEELVIGDKKALNQSMRQDFSIKIAKLQLLKGLWTSKFGFERSNEEMLEAFHLFADCMGSEENYYGANCQLEIGQNYLRQKDNKTCEAFLNQAGEVYKQLFGEHHPINQKYYNYLSELYSYDEQKEPMLEMAQKFLDIVVKTNKPSKKDAPPSLFTMDGYLQLISMQCSSSRPGNEIDVNIKIIEDICA